MFNIGDIVQLKSDHICKQKMDMPDLRAAYKLQFKTGKVLGHLPSDRLKVDVEGGAIIINEKHVKEADSGL